MQPVLAKARSGIDIPGSVQNIDTDQIIPAEYLTLVPSVVRSWSWRCLLAVMCCVC